MVSTLTKKQFKHGVLFYHEHTGIKDIYRGLGDVATSLTTFCRHLSIQLSENEGDIITFCQKIKDKRYSDDVDIIFILGGDGTVNELVNGIMKSELNLPIGIIPGGTFNDFVKTLNLNPRHKMASQQLMNAELRPYDVMKINDEYALNFVGLGLIVQNAENVQSNQKELLGKFSYVFSTLKTVSNPQIYDYHLIADEKEYSGETSMILIANGQHVGGNRIPLEDLSPNDGNMNIFVFENHNFSIINDFFKVKDSMNWNEISDSITHISCKDVYLKTDPDARLDIDGEIQYNTPIEVKVLKERVKLLYLDMEE